MNASDRLGPRFDRLETRRESKDQPVCELEWLDEVLLGRSRAVLWEGTQGFIAPLSYRRNERFDAVCAEFAERGWPVRLRRSGGGLVPQGPGIFNLSLTYPLAVTPGFRADEVYRHLCDLLANALRQIGIVPYLATVSGSFCDGRFNLAVTTARGPCKIAGTAQYWRRIDNRHVVLAHALLLVSANTEILTKRCNEFESALGSGRHYDARALTSVAEAWSEAHPGEVLSSDLSIELTRQIAAALVD